MGPNREWMYTMRVDSNQIFNPEFQFYVKQFLDYAFTNVTVVKYRTLRNGLVVSEIRCPCSVCKNRNYKSRQMVEFDICQNGFMPNYYQWSAHGELYPTQDMGQCSNAGPSQDVGQEDSADVGVYTGYQEMFTESMHQIHAPYYQQTPQSPNQMADTFFTKMREFNEPLWEGCKKATSLSATSRLLHWKSECNVSDLTFDKLLPILKDCVPDDAKIPRNFYETKKKLKSLEMPSQRIHVCINHCILFNGQHSDLDHCVVCKESRYKKNSNKVPNLVMTYMPIGPRLQRLFYSKKIARNLTWHSDHPINHEKMTHPSEGKAWIHFDTMFPAFAQETRNIRLGLCTDGFCPNSSYGSAYSCWPVFITVYNLPPWLSFKHEYMQIPLLIPGKKNPGQNIDVFLQPLVDELKMLFTDGIETYDAYRKNNFQMRVVLLWTVSDFPAYAMLSGWSSHGKLACPYCSHKSGSFWLSEGRKPCWFDCHRKHLPNRHKFTKEPS
ncbi:uncharacterized protein LOC111920288 [Lactuca sativa]|uniref:uncharacterized protein LOC111920288 n=1 Tax=Lactuca sativa TaxID=4236 RepID=UPI0022B03C9E|nr:uncharacterized protein LOC111920288 [Lactuca sativa]